MIGDKESLLFMMTDLVDHCHVTPQWPKAFDLTAANATKPDNVMQYYRDSSFALAYSSFNNSVSGTAWEPLPAPLGTSAFLHCVNDTIAAAVPLMDSLPKKPVLSGGAIAGIVIGGIAFLVISYMAITIGIEHFRKKRREREAEEAALANENWTPSADGFRNVNENENNNNNSEKKDEPKKDEPKKDESKKDEPKKDEENVVYQ
jgi:hypothetical protein